jgi:hypothetical protein
MSLRHFLQCFLLLTLLSLAVAASPPWWTNGSPPVIDANATANNYGPANIGQAKWIVAEALRALEFNAPAIASQVRSDLDGFLPDHTDRIIDFSVPENPKSESWIKNQNMPLLIGQLKSISAPFYSRLAAVQPIWLASQRVANGTDSPNSIFPWTPTTEDDANKSVATIGQLKAVFSLQFQTLSVASSVDSDQDGLPDSWEAAHGLNSNNSADASLVFSGSTQSNLQAYRSGVHASPNATPTNKDGDGAEDDEDADPNDSVVDWALAAEASYAVIEMEQVNFSGYPFPAHLDPLNYWSRTKASIGKGGMILWQYPVKTTNVAEGEWEDRYRIWENGVWGKDITNQSTQFTGFSMSTSYASTIDTWNPSILTQIDVAVDCVSSTPHAVCGDLVLGLGEYGGEKDDLPVSYQDSDAVPPTSETRNDGAAFTGASHVASLWTIGGGGTTAYPIDPPSRNEFMSGYYFGGSAPLMGVMKYKPVASPGGALAILGTQTTAGAGLWKIWNPPGDGGPYVPGQGASTVIDAGAWPHDDMLWIRAIEDGGVAVGERYSARTSNGLRHQVANDHGSESELPGSEGLTHSALAICRVPTGVSGQSRLVAAGTDLWVQKNGQWSTAAYKPSANTIMAVAKNGVLLGTQAIWRNGKEILLDSLVASQKVAGLNSAARYTKLVGYAMNGEGAIVALADDGLHPGSGKKTLLSLLPVEVAVDADRDGEITFDGKDKTTFQKPYRFWVNDDRDIQNDVDDGDSEEDDVDSFANDCDQPGLEYSRDLEDLTRLWIDFSGISQVFPASDPTVALKVRIQSESGDPRFTFFQPVESDGGKQYLKDEATGSSQLQGSYGQELCRVAGTSSVEIPRRAWETLPSNKVVHLLFEGAKAGDAELIFEIWKDGEKVCDLPTVHIVLKKADDMYETWTVGDVVNEGVDYTKWPAATFSQTTGQDLPAPEKPEEKDYIMLVHGWNMPPWEKETYGSTMFKRMWHQGYKGRFGMFRWPTFHGFEGDFEDLTQDPDHFNASELRAWNSASRLKALIENRAAVFGSDKIRLYAHSMGNIVCGEALRQFGPSGASVHSYVAAQAAISSHAYDKTTPARKPAYQLEMPNVYGYYWQQGASDWPPQWEMDGRPSYMNPQYLPGNVAYINHYNLDDYALNGTRWPLNQDLKPGFNYHYTFQGLVGGYSDYRFIRGPRYNQTILNIPADRYEIFSNAADSAANALGKVGTTGGKFSESVNVAPLLVYDGNAKAHKYHSGQFRSTIQKRWEYWRIALDNMDIKTPAQ